MTLKTGLLFQLVVWLLIPKSLGLGLGLGFFALLAGERDRLVRRERKAWSDGTNKGTEKKQHEKKTKNGKQRQRAKRKTPCAGKCRAQERREERAKKMTTMSRAAEESGDEGRGSKVTSARGKPVM
jgi:hypothetical protein